MRHLNDEQLMILWGRGRAAAFDELYVRLHGRVRAHLGRMLGPGEADLDDLVQEAFLRLARAGASWRPRAKLVSWLLSVATNCALQHLRRRRRHPHLRVLPGGEAAGLVVAAEAADPARVVEEREGMESLRAALGAMSAERRAVFLLRQGEGFSYDEVARTLDLPLGTVKTHLHRARTELVRALRRDGGRRGDAMPREGAR